MVNTIYLATTNGLVTCQCDDDQWRVVHRSLDGIEVTSVIARNGIILAGTTAGLQRSTDSGQQWHEVGQGISAPHVRWMSFDPGNANRVFVGTEPAQIFVSEDAGINWLLRPEVAALRDKFHWMLPYSPEAGCVRGFTFHGQRIYAAVEVGGMLRSDDSGDSWHLVKGSDGLPDLSGPPEDFIYPDVHDLTVHPTNADLVFAATGGGLYRSDDGGDSWQLIYDCYCRGLWLDPADPNHLVFGPADRVGSIARLESTFDGGQTWRLTSDGLRVPWQRTMPERISQLDDELLVVLADGRLLSAELSSLEWQYHLPDVQNINSLTAMQA